MFPSSGFFSGVDCPYYLSGLCERPWCHFRHVKSDEQDTAKPSSSNSSKSYLDELGLAAQNKRASDAGPKSSLLSAVGDAVLQVQRDIDRYRQQPVRRYMKYDFVTPNVGQAKYKPTPINKKTGKVELPQTHPMYRPPKPKSHMLVPPVAEYNPTPIHLLKQREAATKTVQQESSMDYDPVSNFSTKSQAPTSRITLGSAGKDFRLKRKNKEGVSSDLQNKYQRLDKPADVEAKFSSDEEEPMDDKSETKTREISSENDVIKEQDKATIKTELDTETDQKVEKPPDEINTVDRDIRESEKPESVNTTVDNISKELKEDTSVDKTNSDNKSDDPLIKGHCECKKDTQTNEKDKEKCKFCLAASTSETAKKIEKRRESSSSDKGKSNGKDSEKENSNKSSKKSSSKHKHKSSKSSRRSSMDKQSSSSSSSSSKHKDKHKSSSQPKDSKHESTSKSKSSSRSHKHKKSSKDKDSKKPSLKSPNSPKRASNIFEAFAESTPKKIERTVSNAELFGDDSDTEIPTVSKKETKSPILEDSDSNDEFIEISSVDSDDSVKKALLTAEDYLFEDEDPYDECLKIFKEQPASNSKPKIVRPPSPVEDEEEAGPASGKVRVARAGDDRVKMLKAAPKKAVHMPSPAEVMHNRFLDNQRRAAEQKKAAMLNGKKRVAHFPRPASSQARSSTTPSSSSSSSSSSSAPSAASGSATGGRVAHVPKVAVKLPRPVIPNRFGSKVPVAVRQKCLNRLIDDCQKIYPDDKDAFERALAEEEAVYDQSSSKIIYMNKVMISIKKLREESGKKDQQISPAKAKATMSHEAMLGGKNAANCHYTLNRSKKEPVELKGAVLYKILEKYKLKEEELVEHGFPRPGEKKGQAVIKPRDDRNAKHQPKDENTRVCCRCQTWFRVVENVYERPEKCSYHWGKCWDTRVGRGVREKQWTCCKGSAETSGCVIADYHVSEANKNNDCTGYQSTLSTGDRVNGDYGIYAMDCEMVYTTLGSEVARVTVVDAQGKQVLDMLIRPDNRVLDYNTRFSGLTRDNMRGVTTNLRDAQAILLNMVNAKTILIGHSLESDLVAMKIIHSTVVDTSVVFPHKMGLPYKRALKTLAHEYLNKIIQDSSEGHDSMEDAVATLELMLHKAKDDARRMR